MPNTKKKEEAYTGQEIVSPLVRCAWPYLGMPKSGGQYDGEYGQYKVDILLDPNDPDHKQFIRDLEDLYDEAAKEITAEEATKKIPSPPLRPLSLVEDEDRDGNPTGLMKITLKRDGGYKSKNSDEPTMVSVPVVGPDLKPFNKQQKTAIGAGSTIAVSIYAKPYFVSGIGGLSLRLNSVQVVNLVEFGQPQASSKFKTYATEPIGEDDSDDASAEATAYKDF